MNTCQIRMLHLLVQTVGKLSDGIRIAQKDGFTSGKMVDYVCRNQPSGRLGIGKLLDRIYLSNKGWQAVRIRRANMEEFLERAIRRQLEASGEVFLLDVALGPGRYILDVLSKFRDSPIEAICWDTQEQWLDEGQEMAADMGLESVLYERCDAMEAGFYSRLHRRPNVVVASGFYEWTHDDERVKESMRLIHNALRAGGYFAFSAQTGHVDLRMVNRVFKGFDSEALRITVRPTATVHNWARQQGFEIVESRSDEWNYHVVSLGRKC